MTKQKNEFLESIGAVLINRTKLEKVKGSVRLSFDWREEMDRLNVEQKASLHFLQLEKIEWITSAKMNDADDELINALEKFDLKDVEKITWREEKKAPKRKI